MKKHLYFTFIVLFALTSCNTNNKQNDMLTEPQQATKKHTLEGVWEIDSYINYRGDGTVDTIKSSNEIKQRKMFSKTKVMWSKLRTWDSLDWFGVGDYTFKDGILTEKLDYGSKPLNKRLKISNKWDFNIIISKDKFTQIEVDSLGNYIYAENYIRVD